MKRTLIDLVSEMEEPTNSKSAYSYAWMLDPQLTTIEVVNMVKRQEIIDDCVNNLARKEINEWRKFIGTNG